MNKHTIAATISKVKANLSRNIDKSEKFGKIIIAPIQPADKFVNSADNTFSLDVVKNFSTMNTLAHESKSFKQIQS